MKNLNFKTVAQILFLVSMLAVGASANRVSLDTTFSGTGYNLQTPFGSTIASSAYSFAVQPDGKIVMGGLTSGDNPQCALIRLNTDGTIDTSFGTNGSTLTTVGPSCVGIKLVIQPDGKILLAGATYAQNENYNMVVLRYTSSGVLDTTFNQTGMRIQNISGDSTEGATEIAVLPDGKILVVGDTSTSMFTQNRIVVLRLNSDGSLDTTLNGSGLLTVSSTADERTGVILVYPNGKILIGGSRTNAGNRTDFLLLRLNADGATDTSFGNNGRTVTVVSTTGNNNAIRSVGLQSDGKIVAGGNGFLTRYYTTGRIDESFGSNGVVNVLFSSEVRELKILPNDKILVAHKFGVATGLRRYTKIGAPDTTFNGGELIVTVPDHICLANEVEIQSDNKMVLVGGCSPNGGGISKFAAFRTAETRTHRHLDFDGDGTTDISVYRPSNGQWWYLRGLSTQTVAATFGAPTDKPVPADYTGDGRADVAVFRPSTGYWYILSSENNTFSAFPFGTSEDIPVAHDFDGDDQADIGVFRPSTGVWYIQKSTGGVTIEAFGMSGDKPVPSDYDGDFKTDIAIYRPSTGAWWIRKSTDQSVYAFEFGTATDKPVQGDYTGDGKTDAAFYRPSTSEWFILRSEDYSYYGFPYGGNGDLPTPGNFSGDERFDVGVFRPSENRWYIMRTGGGFGEVFIQRDFGASGDQLLPTTFVP